MALDQEEELNGQDMANRYSQLFGTEATSACLKAGGGRWWLQTFSIPGQTLLTRSFPVGLGIWGTLADSMEARRSMW